MSLFTTYLGFLNKKDTPIGFIDGKPRAIEVDGEIEKAEFLFVMRNRGNNEIAPTERMLNHYKAFDDWLGYEREYLKRLHGQEDAKAWIQKVADKSQGTNIVLVCYEKDASRCHRTLLAKEIARRFPNVDFRGELTKEGD